ncbi:MAG: hypothetical protein DME05_22455 [Candidatus Rokuibacteriota bacterium]|nr:MAG: hypothetical protein DME05_22455 [Candidatus Rokubacteria bacterium]
MNPARVVVIGGGVAGCSIAYHLAVAGCADVLLLDRGELTGGSTFHSAGLVGQLRSTIALTRINMASVELYRRLASDTGRDAGWQEVGSLRLASSKERLLELERQVGWARTFGLPLTLNSPKEARELFPLMTVDGVEGAAYLPTDGRIDPASLASALADGARQRGVTIQTGVNVLSSRARALRARRQRGRDLVVRDRPHGRPHGAGHPDGPPVPGHQAHRRRHARDPHDARPRPARVLP